ncbi:hypothetical protein H0O02_00265 [Candidatus Micrarchaeota archaeon]|nr:hypothetical protein [Candidatus Micrarchaeota archaeon]
MSDKQKEAKAPVGPPWSTLNQEKPMPKRDPLEEKIVKIEKGLGRKLSDSEKDRVGLTMALHAGSKE